MGKCPAHSTNCILSEIFDFLVRHSFVQKLDQGYLSFHSEGRELLFFHQDGLRNGRYPGKYELPLTVLTIHHICSHCSATSLFALSCFHNVLPVGCLLWLLLSLITLGSRTQFQSCYVWQMQSVPPPYSFDTSEYYVDSLVVGWLLIAITASLCLNAFQAAEQAC